MSFSEDFVHFNNAVPGCLLLMGNGQNGPYGKPLMPIIMISTMHYCRLELSFGVFLSKTGSLHASKLKITRGFDAFGGGKYW